MPKTFAHSLRVLLSRSERRLIHQAAKAAGMPDGRWLRLKGLEAARAQIAAKASAGANDGVSAHTDAVLSAINAEVVP